MSVVWEEMHTAGGGGGSVREEFDRRMLIIDRQPALPATESQGGSENRMGAEPSTQHGMFQACMLTIRCDKAVSTVTSSSASWVTLIQK